MRVPFVLLFLTLLVFPSTVQAQKAVAFETLSVQLLSEYDQPSMLVIYDFEVTAETPIPATVNIRIPKDANLTAVAYLEAEDFVLTEFAGPVEEGYWQTITVFIKERKIYHIEYYEPLNRRETNRSFKYRWAGDYAINNFRIEIQVPGDSTAIKSTPTLPFAPSQEFMSSGASISNLGAEETYQLRLEYSRTNEQTVFPSSSPQVTASEPITENTSGRVTLNSLPYILGGVGLLLSAGAAYYFWQSNALQASKPRRRQRGRKEEESSNLHCHECGTRAYAEDRFCRVCGTKLRTG